MSFLDTLMHLRKSFDEHGWKIAIPLVIGCVIGGVAVYRWDSRQLAILKNQVQGGKQENEIQKDRLRQLQEARDDRASILEKQANEAHQEANTASRQLANAEHDLAQLQGKFDLLNDQNHELEDQLEKFKDEEAAKNADPVQVLTDYLNNNNIHKDPDTISVAGNTYSVLGIVNQSGTSCTLSVTDWSKSIESHVTIRENKSAKFQFDGKNILVIFKKAVCDNAYTNNDDCGVLACDLTASR